MNLQNACSSSSFLTFRSDNQVRLYKPFWEKAFLNDLFNFSVIVRTRYKLHPIYCKTFCQRVTIITCHNLHQIMLTGVLIPHTCHLQSSHHSNARSLQSFTVGSTVHDTELNRLSMLLTFVYLCFNFRGSSFFWSPLFLETILTTNLQEENHLLYQAKFHRTVYWVGYSPFIASVIYFLQFLLINLLTINYLLSPAWFVTVM